jgi:predicted nucleic acid-binding protein
MAASLSTRGTASDILTYARLGVLRVVVSRLVLEETERNLTRKASRGIPRFGTIRALFAQALVEPTQTLIEHVAEKVELKDAPIVAAAITAGVRYLATYDQKHLVSQKDQIQSAFGLVVATPADVLLLLGLAFPAPESLPQ